MWRGVSDLGVVETMASDVDNNIDDAVCRVEIILDEFIFDESFFDKGRMGIFSVGAVFMLCSGLVEDRLGL